jgi:GntR family transcriptional regulator
MIDFRLDAGSGVPTYLQIVQQVRQAIRLGLLVPGDQLPTVKDVVAQLAINPNTVLKAYRELDHDGLVEARRGQGTFVSDRLVPNPPPDLGGLQRELGEWVARARAAGVDDEALRALFASVLYRGVRAA